MSKSVIQALGWILVGMVLMGLIVWFTMPSLMLIKHKSSRSYDDTVAALTEAAIRELRAEIVAERAGGPIAQLAGRMRRNRIRVVLGDSVRVDSYGLKARLDGEVTVLTKPEDVARGLGAINVVEGQYKAFGQDVTDGAGEEVVPPVTGHAEVGELPGQRAQRLIGVPALSRA